jgi:hypothetical protein
VELRYDPNEWANRTTHGRQVFNAGFRLVSADLRGWKLIKTVPMETSRGEGELASIWVRSDDPKRFIVRVSTAELSDWRAAHGRLLQDLRASMRSDIPPGTGELAALGDVNYVGRDPETDAPASISFTRGNIHITVRSVGDQTIAVGDIALRIDRMLHQRPAKAQVRSRHIKAGSIKVGERQVRRPYAVIRSLPRAIGRDGWLQVIAPEGELRREGSALIYVAGEPGPKTLESFLRRRRS